MIDLFQKLSNRHNLWTVYSDFLELAAVTISNAVDFINRSKREKRYMGIISQYNKEEGAIFPKLFGELAMALEEKPTDVLGELFMELELGNKWKGQIFTPIQLSRLMGAVAIVDIDKVIKEKGFITVNELSAGGGSTIIGIALAVKDKGYNYQKDMVVIAQDIDVKAVHMCYIQLSLLGIPAQVCHANTLSLEIFDVWETPFYILGGWQFKKQKEAKKIHRTKGRRKVDNYQ